MVWRIEGHSPVSKEYRSLQEVRSINADGDTVIVVWDGRGIANDGRRYENSYAWILRMADGKVFDGTAFYDSIAFNDLWTRVQP